MSSGNSPAPPAEKKNWWETVTRVAAIAAVFVAVAGYLQFNELKARVEKDLASLQGDVKELNKDVARAATKAELDVAKAQLQIAAATENMNRILNEAKKDAEAAKQEIRATNLEAGKLVNEAKERVSQVDEIGKAFTKLKDEDRKLILAALSNIKAVELGPLKSDVAKLQAAAVETKGRVDTATATLGKLTQGWFLIESEMQSGAVLDVHNIKLGNPVLLQGGGNSGQKNRHWKLVFLP